MVPEPDQTLAVRDPPDLATLANRRHIAVRASLNVIAHDTLNPLGMTKSALFQVGMASEKADRDPQKTTSLKGTVDDYVVKINGFNERAIRDFKVLHDLVDGKEALAPPKEARISSAVGCVLIAINGGGRIAVLRGKSDRWLLARFGQVELAFATLLLHACELAGANQANPLVVQLEDLAAEATTRITVTCSAALDGERVHAANSSEARSKYLDEAKRLLHEHQATIAWNVAPGNALLTIEIPFAKPPARTVQHGS